MELTLTHVRVVDSVGLLVHRLLEWLLRHEVCSNIDTRTQPTSKATYINTSHKYYLDVNELEERERGQSRRACAMSGACHTVRRCDGLKEEEREEAHRRAVRRGWEMGGIGVAACRYKGVGVVRHGADGVVRGAALARVPG
jgi:hypothetical protein